MHIAGSRRPTTSLGHIALGNACAFVAGNANHMAQARVLRSNLGGQARIKLGP